MSFLSHLSWRYATKSFDMSRKVSDLDLDKILEAIRMTPTSFGLQPYHFYIVSNQDIKDQIQAAAWNQAQVGSASHVIVMAARSDIMKTKEQLFDLMTGGNAENRAHLKGYEDIMDGFISAKSESDLLAWASRQVYIAQGFALAACAELEIDSCPMEGFDPVKVGEILGIPENQRVSVIIPIGYRPENTELRPKVRFSQEELFTEIQ